MKFTGGKKKNNLTSPLARSKMCIWRSFPSEQKLDIKAYYEEIAFYLMFPILHELLFVWMYRFFSLHVPVCFTAGDFRPVLVLCRI